MAKIVDIEGIGPTYPKKLVDIGVTTTEQLLECAGTKKGRQEIAEKSLMSRKNDSELQTFEQKKVCYIRWYAFNIIDKFGFSQEKN